MGPAVVTANDGRIVEVIAGPGQGQVSLWIHSPGSARIQSAPQLGRDGAIRLAGLILLAATGDGQP